MMKLEDLYCDLEKYKNFDENNNAEHFLDTVDEIIIQKKPESIIVLLNYFDDDSEYSWVLENLVGAVESYETADYSKILPAGLLRLVSIA